MPEIVIFLGPSLSQDEAERILKAIYRPPAKRGDLAKAVDDGARVIGLIDGIFFEESAVAHREILYAIKKKVRVIGASSMGALRSAELDVLGMEGVGEIYQLYKDGILVSDDEVALVFDPDTGIALSEPLINIRATLNHAEEEGAIDRTTHISLLEAASSLFYPERTYKKIHEMVKGKISPSILEKFCQFIKSERIDLKKQDAVRALEYIRDQVLPQIRPQNNST